MRVAYIVSRFPSSSETFIARELNHVAAIDDIDVELHSLFPATESLVHPSAEPWMGLVQRPSAGQGARDLIWWLGRKPIGVLSLVGSVLAGCVRTPGYLARSLATLPMAASIARRIGETGADHVHAHYATFPALAAWACHRLTGIPYSITVHAHDIFVTQAMLTSKVRDASFVDAISAFNREFLRPYGGDSVTPVHVIHCGIELDRYAYRPRTMPAEGPIEALCVASLQQHKGQRVLLDAIASDKDPLGRIRLTLVGDGPERARLEERARELGVSARVVFAGSQPENEVRGRLDQADLFVLPSLIAADGQMEGLPVALMESLACGVPTVASRLSGIPELVIDGSTGWLAEPGDPVSLRDAISRASTGGLDPEAARMLVSEEFDIARSAASLAALFRASTRPVGQDRPGGIDAD
jgi:colanic acid/amylovoran biosynthesis glycosyltransferase